MKIKLLFAFIAFSLLSCSSDDSSNNNETPVVEKHIKQIDRYKPSTLGGEMQQYAYQKYVNNLITEKKYLFEVPSIFLTYEHEGEGKLTSFNWNQGDFNLLYTIQYDNQDRVVSFHSETLNNPSQMYEHYDYNYEVPGQILVNRAYYNFSLNDVEETSWICYLNNEGYIYKLTGITNPFITEAVYENGNIVSVTRSELDENSGEYTVIYTYNYVYDIEHEIKGEYTHAYTYYLEDRVLNIDANQFGTYNANKALVSGGDISYPRANYLKEVWYNGELSYTMNYIFDEDGYPTEVSRISVNGEIYNKELISYFE